MMHKQTPGILSALQRDPAKLSVISPELQALMALNKGLATGQVSPVAPGPGGPISSVADQKMQQAAQQMQPPQMMPQNVQTAGRQLQNALPTMQQNAQAEQAAQMLQAAQQAQQTQQSPGIAGLDVQNLGQFAEGGVVGYNGDDDSYVDPMGGVYGGRTPEVTAQEQAKLARQPARFRFENGPVDTINSLANLLKLDAQNPELSPEERTQVAKEIQNQYIKLGAMSQAESAYAPTSGASGVPNIPIGASTDDILNFVKKIYTEFGPKQDLSAQEARTQRLEKLLESRPDFLTPAMANIAEERKAGLELLAEREKVRKGNYDPFGLLLSGFATRGITGGPASLRSGKKEYEEAGLTNIESTNKLQAAARTAELAAQRLDYAEKVGNEKEALAARKEYDAAVHNLNQLKNALGVAGIGLAGHMYGADARMEAALMRGLGAAGAKPPPGMGFKDMKELQELVEAEVPAMNPLSSPKFIKFLERSNPELLARLQPKGMFESIFTTKPTPEEIAAEREKYMEARKQEYIAQSKFQAAAIANATPYADAYKDLSR